MTTDSETVPGTTEAALLELDGIRFGYDGGPAVVDGLSLSVRSGEVVGFVGPSGCGKSTLLSLIAGLLQPDGGSVRRVGATADRHPLTMMFQKDTLLPWKTVEDNIGLFFQLSGSTLPRAARRERIAKLMDLAGLQGAGRKYPYELSGGMKRRCAFLSAVVAEPRILLLDEPFSALDEPTRIGIHQDVFRIVKRAGIGVVLITHDLGEAVSLADRVVVLTSRPATAFLEFAIPFGDERNVLALREDHRFLELYGEIWEQLAVQIQRSRDTAGGVR